MSAFEIWAVIAIILVAIEVTTAPGVGFLFGGLAAITIAILVKYSVLNEDAILVQSAVFFVFTAIWAALLWKPMNKMFKRNEKSPDPYMGAEAVVNENDLKKGEIGEVRWSGTIMRAAIRAESGNDTIKAENKVWVHAMQDGVMQVDNTKP
jgi:membrane protein implicated in regulation of membrane protease activity